MSAEGAAVVIYFGADYYPEHWPRETWARDAELMQAAGFNAVRMAEFAWSKLEPAEGRYDFSWLDEVIGLLGQHGIASVLGTPTATPPPWLTTAHPEILPVDRAGRLRNAGSRRHYSATSQVYRNYAATIVTAMAQHYAQNRQVIGWQIDNEFGCHNTTRSYSAEDSQRFRQWLQQRYGTLDALNVAWGTVFWSQTYTDWGQLQAPTEAVYDPNPSLLLDWYRFSSDMVIEFQQLQIDILRRICPDKWITHNLMGFFDELDAYKLAKPLDFVSWDNYYGNQSSPVTAAAAHDLMRSLKQRPFWVMEQQVGNVNWTDDNPSLPPGEARLRTYQAIAHGADGIIYFNWRAAALGAEQLHSGILPHDGIPGRIYSEVKQIGTELQRSGEVLDGSLSHAQVAIIHSYESNWARQIQPHNRQLKENPALYTMSLYQGLYTRNIAVDWVAPETDLSRYRLVIVPALYLLTTAAAENLIKYVQGGGTLVATLRSGFKTESNLVDVRGQPGPLQELFGMRVKEYISLVPDDPSAVIIDEMTLLGQDYAALDSRRPYPVIAWAELLELLPGSTAKVAGYYRGSWFMGEPAITVNRYGAGRAIYLGMLATEALYMPLLAALCDSLAIEPPLATLAGIEAVVRRRGGRRDYVLFLLNHSGEHNRVTLPDDADYEDMLREAPPEPMPSAEPPLELVGTPADAATPFSHVGASFDPSLTHLVISSTPFVELAPHGVAMLHVIPR